MLPRQLSYSIFTLDYVLNHDQRKPIEKAKTLYGDRLKLSNVASIRFYGQFSRKPTLRLPSVPFVDLLAVCLFLLVD